MRRHNVKRFVLFKGFVVLFACFFVLSRTSNFSGIWRLSPLPVSGLQI
jgi:hypothetical protein